ncbi:MAG: SARP family transcriptional regulator [Oscillospiraceae bacterium]|nr:SARP family transcriptional regulator [Oscillospiraceae bacterium]
MSEKDLELVAEKENWNDLLIQVNMFGGLSIRVGEVTIKDSSSRSYQLWNLLEYLIAFRHKTISPEEMYDALWSEDDIENPASALKNLVYRIRSVFGGYDVPFAKSIISYSGGTYQWNNNIPCIVDIEEFEALHKKASNPSQPLEFRIDNYLSAIELYRGDFLAASNYKNWVVPVSSYYKSMYFKCVYEVLRLLAEQERFAEVEMICQKALMVDQFEETAHKYLILSLSRQGQQSRAIAHYKFVSDLFLRELGVLPSASLRNLYRQIAKTVNSVEIDIGIIQQDLRETESAEGAFYCEYEVFKNIYQVLARTAPRIGQSIFVALFTLTDEKGGMPDAELRKKAMDGLFRVMQVSTRRCDVFARFSASQYVLLLPTTSIENCDLVLKRIARMYKQNFRVGGIEMHTNIQPLDSGAL